MRAGKILKKGGFACGSKQLSAFLSRLLLVLFLAKQEKYITFLETAIDIGSNVSDVVLHIGISVLQATSTLRMA